jgi:hypothetical protein
MACGTPDQFQTVLNELVKVTKQYEARSINHVKFFDTLDYIFDPGNYGWSKTEFYKELNTQLGIVHNERKEKPTDKPKKKRAPRKKKADANKD